MTTGLLNFGYSPFLNPLQSQRNVINLGFPSDFDYAMINHLTLGDSMISPFGSAYGSTANTWTQLIDQNGYPNNTACSGGGATLTGVGFGGGFRLPDPANFAGPYVITWDGDGQFPMPLGTWTDASTTTTAVGNANGTATLSGFSSVIGISQGFGITGTGVPGGTTVISVNYSAKTVVVSAAVTAGSGITFTLTNGTYTRNSNGKWTTVAGKKAYVVSSLSAVSGQQLLGPIISATGGTPVSVSSMTWSGGLVTVTTASPHTRPIGYTLSLTFLGATPSSINSTFQCTVTGASTYTFPLTNNPGSITGTITYIAFMTNMAIYRQVDEVDFMPTSVGGNGYAFRAPFKQAMVNMNPAAIRFLNWVNGNNSGQYRFENRSLPSKIGNGLNATAGPAYGTTTGTNVVSLAAVTTPTAGNSNLTPASMVHGEVVCCRALNSTVRSKTAITGITKANPGVVNAVAHGFSSGDLAYIKTTYVSNAPAGMVQLDCVAVTVTVVDVDHVSIADLNGVNIDTTTFGTWTAGNIMPFITLQVGSGNDRTAYPVLSLSNAETTRGDSGAGALTANTYYTFYFDKNLAAYRTAGTAGTNWVKGSWSVSSGFPSGDVPLEYCAALVAEVNILALSQGISNPIHLWMTTPPRCLLSCDPDYTTASAWPLNAYNVMMNGGFGYLGLNSTKASMIFEWSNELWNFGTPTANYCNWLAFTRGAPNIANFENIQALRATRCMTDLGTQPRLYKTIGMQGTRGWDVQNQFVALGNFGSGNIIFTDPWNNWGAATPLSFHDAVNYASYFDPDGTYSLSTLGLGGFTDDSAMFNGTSNTINGGGDYTGAANTAQAITNFITNVTSGTGQSINNYCSQSNPSAGHVGSFVTGVSGLGKYVIGYEGGTDWPCNAAGPTGGTLQGHTITSADSLFLNAVNQSTQWATAQKQYFNNCATLAFTGPQAIFTFVINTPTNLRWCYASPDTYSGGVEGAALNTSPMWLALGARNQALTN